MKIHCSVRNFGKVHRVLIRLAIIVGLAPASQLVDGSQAHASLYYVYTSATSAMSVAHDGYCSFAEAVGAVNGTATTDCPDASPGGDVNIYLMQASGKSYTSYPFTVTSLTINSPNARLFVTGASGGQALINTTGMSGFIIKSGSVVLFQHVNLTYTGGSTGGRLVENYGTLRSYEVTFANGNVTAHPNGTGGAIYNAGTIDVMQYTNIQNSKAKKGGGIYNDNGNILDLAGVTISQNQATMAGGGIYNFSTAVGASPGETVPSNITGSAVTITKNSAPAGGGVFNRGRIDLDSSFITHNTASGTGSKEACASAQSCDGAGGGVLSVAYSSSTSAGFGLVNGSTLSDNTATGLGGGTYSAGRLNLVDVTISHNQAKSGGAIYSAVSGDNVYCSVSSSDPSTQSSIVKNLTSPAGGYSIIDVAPGTPLCYLNSPPRLVASENIPPLCAASSGNPGCPQ